MIMPTLTLRKKTVFSIVGISIATIAALAAVVISFIQPQLETKLEKRGQSIAHALSSQCINPILTRKLIQLDMIFREFIKAESGVEYIYVLDPNGEVTAHSFGREFPVDLKRLSPRIDAKGLGKARISTADCDIIDISLPLLEGTLGRIHVGMAYTSIQTDVRDILMSLASVSALFLFSSLLMVFFLERWIVKPVLTLTAASVRAEKGDLEQRVEVLYADEVGNLAVAFNNMLDAVKESRETLLKEKELLAESEARFRQIIEKSPISMAIVTMDGTIEYINRCAIETFGYQPEDIPDMGVWWQKAYPDPAYRDKVITQWMGLLEKAIAENSYIERRDYRVTCKNGALKTMLIFGVLIANKVFVMFEDITERKLAEDEIRRLNSHLEKLVDSRTSELLNTNRDLSSFCYAISHELRAPVARLSGLSRALQEDWSENPAEAEYCAKRIEVASGELQRVIDSVLQLSRLSQASFVPQPLNMSSLVRVITNALMTENPERRFDVIIAEDIAASGDAALVRLCLENLLGNAFKYTARQSLARIEFGHDTASGGFYVRDNGIGFDSSHADNLFEPFTRLHPEEEFIGSGIGLATVQRIIERHGGRIWAKSSPGNGATFYFTLAPPFGDRHDA
jgi:PAS domain S-box-containing protein